MADGLRGFAKSIAFRFRCVQLRADDEGSVPVTRRRIQDRNNPVELYNDCQFHRRYRFSKQTVMRLMELLSFERSETNRGLPVPPLLQLLAALRFYGAGTFQVVTGDLAEVSQPTASRIIRKVSSLIAGRLYAMFVRFPTDTACVMRRFHQIAGFPGVSGCIDCTHIVIKSPGGDDAEVYRNRKTIFSLNVQVSNILPN